MHMNDNRSVIVTYCTLLKYYDTEVLSKSPVSSVVEHQTFNLRVMGSTPISGDQIFFCLFVHLDHVVA